MSKVNIWVLVICDAFTSHTYTYLPASVAKRRVASLWHVVGVWSATGRQLPGANGRGRGRGRGGA